MPMLGINGAITSRTCRRSKRCAEERNGSDEGSGELHGWLELSIVVWDPGEA
jgi:hypothetical protein